MSQSEVSVSIRTDHVLAAVVLAAVAFAAPSANARPDPEEAPPSEFPRDAGLGVGPCDNYRCGCGDQCACGAGCGCGSSTAPILLRGQTEFESQNVLLRSRVSVQEFGAQYNEGNDCWGYVSPSGREYALMGLNSGLGVVDITDPVNPNILGTIDHPDSPWADVKTFGEYAYVVNESGGGVQIIDLSDVDNGNIALVGSTSVGGAASTSHNIAINTDSGYAYLCGSNGQNGGLIALDLSDPTNPTFAGAYNDLYVHDAEIVSFTDGPNAGREIAFCFVGGAGLDIVDVTNKSNMFRISRTTYAGLNYSHQGWFDRENNIVYLNDELDEVNGAVPVTTTRVFDVSSLSAPNFIGSFTTGLPVIDHNLYTRDGFVFEANYRSGLRIFDATDNPANPVEVGFFDTFSGPDDVGFDGAWSVYPFFPSGNVIVSDIQGGLFVLDPSFAIAGGVPATIELLSSPPEVLQPAGQSLQVNVATIGGALLDGSPQLIVDDGESVQATDLIDNGNGEFTALFPPLPCAATVEYYFSALTADGVTVNEPLSAPALTFSGIVASEESLVFTDDFETDIGWSVGAPTDTATTGIWERVDPNPTDAQPGFDNPEGEGTLCYITGNAPIGAGLGANDVDDGATTLTSPQLDASGDGVAFVEYYRWFSNDTGANPGSDTLRVSISDDNGQTWVDLEETAENANAWVRKRFRIDEFVEPTDRIRLRFVAADEDPGSIVEAGVDDVRVFNLLCADSPAADLNGDGLVGSADLAVLLGAWGVCAEPGACVGDLNGDGAVDSADLAILLGSWD